MIPADHHGRRHRPGADELVDREARLGPVAVAEPADAGRQALERDPLRCELEPALEERVVGEQLLQLASSIAAMSAGSPDSTAQRNGPIPRQKSGRI